MTFHCCGYLETLGKQRLPACTKQADLLDALLDGSSTVYHNGVLIV
jgi:hypothetical protein